MIAAARRQNYGSAATLGRCWPPCMVDFCVYLFYRAAVSLVAALPLRFVFSLGNVLGFFAWCLLPNYRRLARQNVEIAFGPEKTTIEKRRIVRRHFQRLGANLLSGIKLNAMPSSKVAGLVAVEGAELVHHEPDGLNVFADRAGKIAALPCPKMNGTSCFVRPQVP